MISDERKQTLIEGTFYQAECLNELRWLNSQFALVLNSLPLRAQFQLSGVLERRVSELENGNVEDRDEVSDGASDAQEQSDTEGSVTALRLEPPCSDGPAEAPAIGTESSLRTEGN